MTYLGISQSDLVTVYLSVVRPVGLLEYDCPVWHTNSQHYTCQTFIRTIYVGFCLIEFISTTTDNINAVL